MLLSNRPVCIVRLNQMACKDVERQSAEQLHVSTPEAQIEAVLSDDFQ